MDVTEGRTQSRETLATPLPPPPSEATVGNCPGGPRERQAGQVRCLPGEPSPPAEAPPGVLANQCATDGASNHTAGWHRGLPGRQPIPSCPSPPRQAESGVRASERPRVAWALAFNHCQFWHCLCPDSLTDIRNPTWDHGSETASCNPGWGFY